MAVARSLILIPFRLPQISCFTLSLTCFSSDSDSCPTVGIRPLFQFPHPLRAGPVLLTSYSPHTPPPPVPLSYWVFAWLCIFFSAGQVLLSPLSWCSACISKVYSEVSKGVFLMYPWRAKILFGPPTPPLTCSHPSTYFCKRFLLVMWRSLLVTRSRHHHEGF